VSLRNNQLPSLAQDEGCSHQPQNKLFSVNWRVPVSIGVGTLPPAKTVDARIDLAKMAKKWSSSKTIMQNDTYRVLTLRLVVWTLTLPQVRKAPGTPPAGVPGAVYDEYLSTAPHGVSVYSLRILTFAPGCHRKPTVFDTNGRDFSFSSARLQKKP